MVYIGSKRRIKKYIIPIIESYITPNTTAYIEPMGGGGNVIDSINFDKKYYYDIHPQLVALLKHVAETTDDLPQSITKKEYNLVKNNREKYPDWYVGLVGFCASFGSKYFGGFAGHYKKNGRDRTSEMIRNIIKQAPNLQNIEFNCSSFEDIVVPKGSVIYCDPPYKGTTKYKTEQFPYERFYSWCKEQAKDNIVLISEYNMPDDFECIWEHEITITLEANRKNGTKKVEKLFKA